MLLFIYLLSLRSLLFWHFYPFVSRQDAFMNADIARNLSPRSCSVSDGDKEIVTNERYVVMPWKMVTRWGVNMTLKEVVEEIEKLC